MSTAQTFAAAVQEPPVGDVPIVGSVSVEVVLDVEEVVLVLPPGLVSVMVVVNEVVVITDALVGPTAADVKELMAVLMVDAYPSYVAVVVTVHAAPEHVVPVIIR